MKVLRPAGDPAAFFARLASAPSRLLLVDYDGTLAPFRTRREEAVPYPAARAALREVQADGRTRVVVISGRALRDLRPLLGLEPAPELWGSHGWERMRPGGALEPSALGEPVVEALGAAARAALEVAPPERVERKPSSVALHVRGLAAGEAERLLSDARSRWEPLLDEHPLAVHRFDGGIELRATGRDKGSAVMEILSEEPPGTAVAYLGDDMTDEDAFRALSGRGLSVLVRGEPRETAADLWIRPPEELVDFLQRWRLHATGAPVADAERS